MRVLFVLTCTIIEFLVKLRIEAGKKGNESDSEMQGDN